MVRDAHYRAKLAFRARGLADLARHVGGIEADLERRLEIGTIVRILEIGCGYGTALLELASRYGDRVELHGINREPHDGDAATLARNAADRGIAVDVSRLPSLHYGDVAHGLPFADATFDLVYSQVAWMYFANKLGVLREVQRVLRHDGIARIDADEVRPGLPPEHARLVEIWERGTLVPLGDYVRRHDAQLLAAPEGHYLEVRAGNGLGDDVELVHEIDLSRIHAHWDGIQCIYRTCD
jgi:SAM-dependent methyltransferase